MTDKITVSPDDMLAMLAFRSQQIMSSCGARANGSAFPDPNGLRSLVAEMLTISDQIVEFMATLKQDAA